MKEHPILFSGEMIRAILDGRKTQTRRGIQLSTDPSSYDRAGLVNIGIPPDVEQRWTLFHKEPHGQQYSLSRCRYGKPGDRLWVREGFYQYGKWIKNGRTKTGKQAWTFKPTKHADGEDVRLTDNPPEVVRPNKYRKPGWYKRPSIFMPRWASRILLELTDVRVERLQEISAEDCIAEGIEDVWSRKYPTWPKGAIEGCRGEFRDLWNSINAKRGLGWDVNPWVWVVEFKKL